MWQRFSIEDFWIIIHYIGRMLIFLAISEIVPLLVALGLSEWNAMSRYLLGGSVAFVAGILCMLPMPNSHKLSNKNAMAVVGLSWIVLTVFAAIPLFLSGHYVSYLDSVFESMSALTTTGASMVNNLDHMAQADVMWRIFMQCIGGCGVVVIATSLGMFGRSLDSSLYASEGRSEHVVPNIVTTSRFIVKYSLIITLIAAALLGFICVLKGMEPVRGFLNGAWLAMASFATGGMTSMSPGIVYYHSGMLEVIVLIVILLGSINFTLHNEVWRGHLVHFFKDLEIRTLFVWLLAICALFVACLCAADIFDEFPILLRHTVFTVVSAFSSTGFQTISTNQLASVIPGGAIMVLAFCMMVGGSSGSTNGGIKVFRIGVMFKELIAFFKDVTAPDSARQVVTYYHVGRHPLTVSLVRANMAVIFIYTIVLLVAVVVTLAYGYDASIAVFECTSMTSNIGMSAGIISPGMPDLLKVIYIFCMWAGRLEFIAIIATIFCLISSIGNTCRKHKKKVQGLFSN